MKRSIILVAILLIASLGLITAFAETPTNPARLMPAPKEPNNIAEVKPDKINIQQPQAQDDLLADPNKIEAALKSFKGLQTELDEVTSKGGEETRLWLQREADNRVNLAKSANEQVMAEIRLIRKLAVEEGAKKTTAAIDGLLLNRQRRLDNLIEKLQQERRELRREQSARTRQSSRQRMQQDRRIRGRQSEEEQYEETQEQYQPRSRSRRR